MSRARRPAAVVGAVRVVTTLEILGKMATMPTIMKHTAKAWGWGESEEMLGMKGGRGGCEMASWGRDRTRAVHKEARERAL